MATKKFVKKTPEQRKAERENILSTIEFKVESLTNSKDWADYLRFAAAFRRYSINNQLLIQIQCPGATRVAGFRQWEKFGRHVVKGQKGIKILGYSSKKKVTEDPVTKEETVTKFPIFPILSVFDVSQTEGDALPTGGYVLPTGADSDFTYDRLAAWLLGLGWKITTEDISGGTEGFTDHKAKEVVIKESLSPAAKAQVLLHEAGHVVLHEGLAPTEYQEHRGVWETEAESVAYVLAILLGADPDSVSVPYIAGWSAGDAKLIKDTAANVLRAVNVIAEGIGLDATEEVTEPATAVA